MTQLFTSDKRFFKTLRWLIVANAVGFFVLCGIFGFRAWTQWKAWQQQKATLLQINARTGNFTAPEADRLYELAHSVQMGHALSDSDVRWCLSLLDIPQSSHDVAASRFLEVSNILSDGVSRLSLNQHEMIFQKMSAVMANDTVNDTLGLYITQPSAWFRLTKDRRALTVLQPFRMDRRQMVRYVVQETLTVLNH